MITRETFCTVLDGLKDYRASYGISPKRDLDTSYDIFGGSVCDAEPVVLTLLSEGMNDKDHIIEAWINGACDKDASGVPCFEPCIPGLQHSFYRIASVEDLYDYLLLLESARLSESGVFPPKASDCKK